ncbi:MAG: tRNA guanosine(15) transglycosylase TgtA [Desulfurococcales archaeon]|nr:tRNA guanosine(15) transglycosylase TgtA [Desulfurococcales archaeon]
MFEAREVDLAGRIGRLHTAHGTIETPAFFPVIDLERQEVSLEDISRLGFRQVITNAYLLLKRYGREPAEKGVHRVLGWDGIVMTDSGAYQILQYGSVDVSLEEIVRYQAEIGSDISVILDIPTGDTDRATAEWSVEETLRRARRALALIRDTKNLWVLPVQGGRYLDLVEKSAREARKIPGYSIYAVGSPTVFLEKYDYYTVLSIVAAAKRNLPPGRPVHLFGAGHPLIIPYAVALGIDMFDSASYILYARDDRVFTSTGVERLDRLHYLPCECPHCSRYTPQELLAMEKRERTRILALHNLCMIRKSIDETKQAIKEGRLWELLEALSHHHPSTYESMHAIVENADYIYRFSPRVRGVVRGVRAYTSRSLANPRLHYYRYRVLGFKYEPRLNNKKTLLLAPYPSDIENCPRPDPASEIYILLYHPVLGVVPSELCGVFPTIHVHWPERAPERGLLSQMVRDVVGYVSRVLERHPEMRVVVDARDPWGVRKDIVADLGLE